MRAVCDILYIQFELTYSFSFTLQSGQMGVEVGVSHPSQVFVPVRDAASARSVQWMPLERGIAARSCQPLVADASKTECQMYP